MIVAHFSDVHALSLKGVSLRDFLNKRLAGGINVLLHRGRKHSVALAEALIDDLNRLRPDHVVVTGDLTNLSLESEFVLARSLLDRISLGPREVTVIPGNHDVYVWAAYLRQSFERAIGPYAISDGAVEPHFPVVRVRGALAVVGISTAVPSPIPLADGWVGRRQLAEVEQALEWLGRAGKFRLVLIHHPPMRNRHAYLRGLRDRDKLQAVLRRVGAELIVHGHEHRNLQMTLPGPTGQIPVIGVGSATYTDARLDRCARYNLYHIEGSSFTIDTRVFDPASQRFVAYAA